MGRYNFKNYEYSRKDNLNSNLDINKLSKKLVNRPLNSSYRKNDSYKVGVVLYFMSGQTYKTPEFTVDDIYDALQRNKRWLETIILPKPLRLKESLLDKINQDKEKHGYKEIETMIVDALDNYYEGC